MILDQHQLAIQKNLKQLAELLQTKTQESFVSKIFTKKTTPIKSLYIYGDVGRGKSMLMKDFFDSITNQPKIYIHFNSFMHKIHEALRDIRKEDKKYKDELIEAVQRVAKDKNNEPIKLICFDEFQVTDIADAMLLARIFSYLFAQNVVAVFTSNSKPSELYKNGLQRELFLEFVNNVLLKNCQVLNLNSTTDYREKIALSEKEKTKQPQQETKQSQQEGFCSPLLNFITNTTPIAKRYFISNQKNRTIIEEIIKSLTNNQFKPTKINVWGREVKIKKTHERIAIINFSDLCQNDYAASDFQAICQKFDLIFLLKVPNLTEENVNEAKRFTLFIDEVYENKTALIVSAKTKIDEIYPAGIGSSAFKRTASRLKEIKTEQYWKNSKFFS